MKCFRRRSATRSYGGLAEVLPPRSLGSAAAPALHDLIWQRAREDRLSADSRYEMNSFGLVSHC
jgi:hypothetical protein